MATFFESMYRGKSFENLGSNDSGLATRDSEYKKVLKESKDNCEATRAYCSGNKWLEENARSVGNI